MTRNEDMKVRIRQRSIIDYHYRQRSNERQTEWVPQDSDDFLVFCLRQQSHERQTGRVSHDSEDFLSLLPPGVASRDSGNLKIPTEGEEEEEVEEACHDDEEGDT